MSAWPANPPESTAFPFKREERARLAIYRAAVAAGFFTDTLSPHTRTPSLVADAATLRN